MGDLVRDVARAAIGRRPAGLVAARAGVSPTTVRRVLAGHDVRVETLARICAAAGCVLVLRAERAEESHQPIDAATTGRP